MNVPRSLSAALGIGCLVIGLLAAMSDGGTMEATKALGNTLIIAGAILIVGGLISSAIANSRKE